MLRAFAAGGANDLARLAGDFMLTTNAFGKAGRRFAAGAGEVGPALVRVFEAPTWQETHALKLPPPELRSIALSADGRFVAASSNWQGGPWLFDLDASPPTPQSLGGPTLMSSVAISGDGAWVASTSVGLEMQLFDRRSGKPVPIPNLPPIHAVALSDDGLTLAAGAGSIDVGEVLIRRLPGAAELARVPFNGPAMFVVISPDGRWVAASNGIQDFGSGVRVINAADAKEQWSRTGVHPQLVAFSRDGNSIMMAGIDGTLRIFETATGRETFQTLLERPVKALAFDEQANGLMVASAVRTLSGTTAITLTRYLTLHADLIEHACARVTRNLTAAEWDQYVGAEVPYRATCDERR
jgi:WD40 repeat protein